MDSRHPEHEGVTYPVPVWDWYQKRKRFRAMRMDKPFDVVNPNGTTRGVPGEWLVEDHEGKNQERFTHQDFLTTFERMADWKQIPEKDVL